MPDPRLARLLEDVRAIRDKDTLKLAGPMLMGPISYQESHPSKPSLYQQLIAAKTAQEATWPRKDDLREYLLSKWGNK